MEKCNCYHEDYGKSECWGTKERDVCSCDGDETKCNFYTEKRASAQARKVIEEFKKNKEYTYKETKEQFLNILNSNGYIGLCEVSDMKNVISALDKQIPKKPVGDLHSMPHYRCPNCKNAVVVYQDDYKYPNCKWCGQALLWE